MRIYNSDLTTESLHLPTLFEFEQILYFRKAPKFEKKKHQQNFKHLEKGVQGENRGVEYLQKNGLAHWELFRNVWFNYAGTFECDALLNTGKQIYVIEFKNYSGIFTYQNGECKINGRKLSNDCIAQTTRAKVNMQNMLSELHPTPEVNGVLVFIGLDNWLDIKSEITHLNILMSNQFLIFIEHIIKKERNHSSQSIHFEEVRSVFQKYKGTNPYAPKPIDSATLAQLKKGIGCAHCHGFDLRINKYSIQCRNCGAFEDKEIAVLRTIHEYGVLNFESHLTTGALMEFLDQQMSRKYLVNILKKHFKMFANGRYTSYANPKVPFDMNSYKNLLENR